MGFLLTFFLFTLGLCVGSFLSVLIYRLPRSLSPFKGWSFCPKCKHRIAWQDNIPLLSFIFLKGKCRYCHFPISWQYPLVELVTGILTVVSFQFSAIRDSSLLFPIYWLLITYALIVIFVSDLRYGTVPDKIVYPAIGLAIIYSLFAIRYSLFASFLSGLGAAGFFLALVALTRGQGMGMGDVKLAFLMGLILGFPQIIVALYLAFLTGAGVGVILILLGKKHFGEHIPFGPFLTLATFISFFWGEQILRWYLG